MFPGDKVQAVAHHVTDAELNPGLRENGLDGLWFFLAALIAEGTIIWLFHKVATTRNEKPKPYTVNKIKKI